MTHKPHLTTRKVSDSLFRLKPLVAAVRVVIAGGLFVGSAASVYADLPVPIPGLGFDAAGSVVVPDVPVPVPVFNNIASIVNVPVTAPVPDLPVPVSPEGFVTSGNVDLPTSNGTKLEINQHSDKAILNWKSFNVGADKAVQFNQPGSSSVALNNIFQGSPSLIYGHINANGQIYLVNSNGFVFHKGSVVDANTLVASALNISDEVFKGGILSEFDKNSTSANPAAALNGQTGVAATEVKADAKIHIENGASIKVGKNGNIILAAPTVENSGSISADKQGQILLVASKDKVYLQTASSDPQSQFAGLLVEVGSGGKVINHKEGDIAVRQGSVTLAGFAVNQDGRINATTSVNVNGSVRLLAREKAIADNSKSEAFKLVGTKTTRDSDLNDGLGTESKVIFGKNSAVNIQADADGATAIDEQAQKQSIVEVSADKIQMQSGSSIVAHNANVNFTATNNLIDPVFGNKGRIDLENGSLIDVSGTKNVQVAMERNVADVSVQSFNLRNSPYQRGGVLQGKTVQVDVRNLPSIIDAGIALSGIRRSVEERMGKGGEINLTSSGDVIVNNGAKTDISGGSVRYQDGYINTTKLLTTSGRIVDISNADPNEQFGSILGNFTESHPKWDVTIPFNSVQLFGSSQFEKGYVEGKAAGSLNIQSPLLLWQGQLNAGAVSGIYQRDNPVAGGSLTINEKDNTSQRQLFVSSQNVLFQNNLALQNIGFEAGKFPLQANGKPNDLVLTNKLVNESGISELIVKTGGKITVASNASITMPMLSNLGLEASAIDVNGSVYSAGGKITFNSLGNINIANSSVLDVSGRWVNDYQKGTAEDLTDSVVIDGGSINLKAENNLTIDKGTSIKADGGAWLNATGNQLKAGNAGTIKLAAGMTDPTGSLQLKGGLSAYGLNNGGSLSISVPKINVGTTGSTDNAFNLGVSNGHLNIAPQLGFSKINLKSTQDDITIKSGTDLTLATENRLLASDFRSQADSKSIAAFSTVGLLNENLRSPVSLDLNAAAKNIIQEAGSIIRMDKGSTVNLTASNFDKGIYVDGLIDAPGGSINLALNVDPTAPYNPGQSIWLGSQGSLSTQGTTRLNPQDALGRTGGTVLDGGDITITANRGYVILEKGSKIDVSGSSAQLDILSAFSPLLGMQYTSQLVGSNAGNIKLLAAEGIVLDGSLSANAGSATNSAGGLSLTLDRNNRGELPGFGFPINPLTINVVQADQTLLGSDNHFGTVMPDRFNGNLTVSSEELKRSGIADLKLAIPHQAQSETGKVNFKGDVNLNIASSINVDSQTIAWSGLNGSSTGNVNLDTAFLQIGSSTSNTVADTSVLGGGKLTAKAMWTQLTGATLLTGFKEVNLNNSHDLRVNGVQLSNQRVFKGNLTTAADLNLTASQIYPTTLTDYTISVTSPNGKINISGVNTDATPLSAAGKLAFNAPVINQDGVLKAPLGTIELNASSNLTFGKHSLTSVSADGKTIPLGLIANNIWKYPLLGANANLVFNELPDNLRLGEKHLVFKASDIEFKKGSIVDVSGGGDLLAAEFQPGLGGDFDYLDPSSKSYQGGFAILPSLGSSLAPSDHFLSANFSYDPRSKVYLSGTDTLPAGEYTILPARYALLPGAYLVTPQSGTQDQTSTSFNRSGLPIVSGYQILAGTNVRNSRTSGFLVETRADVLKHAQYNVQTANNFFTTQAKIKNTSVPLLPVDSGQISIDASTKLVLEGQFNVAAQKGRGARMDIAAKSIKVVKNRNGNGAPGTLEILDQDLSNLGVDSLLLGGTRTFDNLTGHTNLTVSADDVTFDEGAQLQTLDLVAAGKNSVEVKNGATLNSTGTVNTGDSTFKLTGDSALLRVSADRQVTVDRDGSNGSTGIVKIDQGAVLKASKSILLNASKSDYLPGEDTSVLDGDIIMQGGSLSLTANAINLGEVSGSNPNSFDLSNQKLANLAVDDLLLNSRTAINFYGNVGEQDSSGNLTPIHFNNLVLDAGALSGFNNAGKVASIQATHLLLQNNHDLGVPPAGNGTGTLNLNATAFEKGRGDMNLDGFDKVNIKVDKQLLATGNSQVNVAADLNVTAGSIATTSGHTLAIDASAGNGYNVVITGNGNPLQTTLAHFGGHVSVNANNVTLNNANVLLPSGSLKLQAQTGDIQITGKTGINLAGRAVNFADNLAYTPGGTFSADAKHGKITLDADSHIDVRSGGGAAPGGNLIFKAPEKTLELSGDIKAKGASAAIDVSGFEPTQNFDGLMNKLMAAGVSRELYVRARDADIVQEKGNVIAADNITLAADKGAIDIFGHVNADGSKNGGEINLYAGDKVSLENGALLTAKVNDAGQKGTGGKITLSSIDTLTTGHSGIEIKSGSTIDVSGSSNKTGGEVILNALRTGGGAGTGINIQPIAGAVKGYSHFYAQGVKTYKNADIGNDYSLDSQDTAKIDADTAAFMTSAAQTNVEGSLGGGIRLRPYDFIDYTGNLTVATNWDLPGQRFGKDLLPGVLAIRSTDQLTLNGSITDGFENGVLQTSDSWSLQLVAGADQNSADKLATAAQKDLVLNSNVSIHTGTGDIKLAASGDLVLTDQTSTIYSAGRADPTNRYGTQDGGPDHGAKLNGEYPVDGGNLVIRAGHDIKGAISNQFINSWLPREGGTVSRPRPGNPNRLTAWAVNASAFEQNIGSFGGGKVDIAALGNIDDLSVMMPTTGKQQGLDFTNNTVDVQGGGQMLVSAGGDISGGSYFLGKGDGIISAGGEIKGSTNTDNSNTFVNGPQLVMSGDQKNPTSGDAKLTLNANQGIKLSAVSDAMVLNPNNTKFFTYTENSKLTLNSLAGDIHLNSDTAVIESLLHITENTNPFDQFMIKAYPASLDATAFNGSVLLDSDVILFPSPVSNINILAQQDIASQGQQHSIIMSDADPALMPNVSSPLKLNTDSRLNDTGNKFDTTTINAGGFTISNLIHASTPIHGQDKVPARLITQEGDITGVQINLPKPGIIQAGRDLSNNIIQVQNINLDDATLISAGRDISYASPLDRDGNLDLSKNNSYKIEIGGPGNVTVKTGRNLDLGSSSGLSTVGNLVNSNLSSNGASLDVIVGLKEGSPNYIAFIDKYLQNNPLYKDQFNQVKTLLTEFMRQRSGETLMSPSEALAAFRLLTISETLPVQAQLNAILSKVFFNELKIAGSASAVDKSIGNKGGYEAIETLFPGNKWKGDLSLFFSKMQTISGGDINLLVPGGLVNAGLAVAPGGGAKTADQLGIVAQKQGEINAFVKNDFIVNTSRVFTLGGGDILIWSSEGNIDAGKGAKSALSVTIDPPYLDKVAQQLVIPVPRITNGSGIRTASSPGIPAGNVFLFAPQGVVDAGEAGIAGNNVTISATAVLGAGNISIGGVGAGVPVAPSGSLAAGLTGTGNVGANVSQVAQDSTGLDKNGSSNNTTAALGIMTTELLGYGGSSEEAEQKKPSTGNKKS